MPESKVIRVTAPGRAGIIGNPTDGYGGTVISSAISQRAWCEIRPACSWTLDVEGIYQEIHSEEDLSFRNDNADMARAVLRRFWPVPPAALSAGTQIPIRAGLAGSTAILTVILKAVLEYTGRTAVSSEVAELARSTEFDILNITCGFQDHYMIAFGGVNYMDFRGKEPGAPQPHPWATIEPISIDGCSLILGHTGIQRVSGSVHKGLRERWIEGDRAVVDGYLRISTLAREGKKAIFQRNWPLLGKLMNENHAIQRDLGGSGDANERLIKAALDGGALGAKLAGAGAGGTIISLCEDPERVMESLEAVGAERAWPVQPSGGLRREH